MKEAWQVAPAKHLKLCYKVKLEDNTTLYLISIIAHQNLSKCIGILYLSVLAGLWIRSETSRLKPEAGILSS